MTVQTNLLKLFNPAGGPTQQLAAGASFAASGTTIVMASAVPAWVVAGMNVYDVTNSQQIGVVAGSTGTTLTLSATIAHASSGAADVFQFGFTPSDINVGYTAGADIRGIVQECILKAQEIDALMSYLETDVITSSQDSAANTLLAGVVTALS